MTRFIVVGEHTLGCVNDRQPQTVQILASSVIRGAVFTWQDGTIPLPSDPQQYRPATRADFDTFRVSYGGYDNPAHYYPLA
jgi:hypothetical protein